MSWTLWHTDLFDRETPPSREARGADLQAGLAALWRSTLAESITPDGQRSFSSFSLDWEGAEVVDGTALVDTFREAELVRLRGFVAEQPGLLGAVSAAHLRLLRRERTGQGVCGHEEARAILDEIAAAVDLPDLRLRLASLQARR